MLRTHIQQHELIIFILIILLWVPSCVSTQNKNVDNKITKEQDTFSKQQDFVLGPGDELNIEVWNQENLERKVKIDADSGFYYPLVGRINVDNKNVEQVRKLLSEKLHEFYVDPQVSVFLTQVQSRKIYVLGEVNSPGVKTLENKISAFEAISQANDFTNDANKNNVLLLRQCTSGVKTFVLNLNVLDWSQGNYTHSYLHDDDILYVPTRNIANWERFMNRLTNIISPILTLERGIVLAPDVKDVLLHGELKQGSNDRVIVAP